MVYTITLNPALDYVVRVEDVSLGGVNRTQWEEIQYGGKGINVSVVFQELGVESTALGFAAGFTGRALEDLLHEQGIRTDFITLPEGITRINIKVKADEETEINGRGPAIGSGDIDKLLARIEQMQKGDWVVLAGSIPANLPDNIYATICAQLAAKGTQFVVDTAGDSLRSVLGCKPFLVKPNLTELGELFGEELRGKEDIIARARKLQKEGAQNVLVSMAGEGALLAAEDGNVYFQEPANGEVQNSVGAGDSMVAGFVAGWMNTGRYDEALRLGTAAGGATAFSKQLATRAEIDNVLETL